MRFFVKYLDSDGREILGTSGVRIVSDLKTVKGVINRIYRNFKNISPRAVKYEIYRISEYNFYDETQWKLVYSDKL